MDPILIGAGITAAATAVSQWWKNRQDKQRYEQQLADERANWRMQNQYNSPSQQMARLKSAGLNPNLVYQQGGALSGSGEMSTPNYAEAPLMDYQNIASQALSFDSAIAAINNTKANTEKTKQETYGLLKTNEEMDRKLGSLQGATLLNQEEREYYASLFGVDPNNVQDLSVRGASILSDLRAKFHNNKNLDQTYWQIFHNSSKTESEAALAKFASLIEMLNLDTESRKHGWIPNYYGGYVNGERQDWIAHLQRDPKSFDRVLDMFLRELKEVHWQSSDAKHIIDSTTQVFGSLPKLKFSSTPEEYYRKHKK